MPTPTSTKRESFKRSQDLKQSNTGRGWICTVCPTTRKGPPFFPSFQAALNHERTAHEPARPAAKHDRVVRETPLTPENYLQTTGETHGDKIHCDDHIPLTSEGLRQWEMQAHVDHVFDLVPFWQRGIDAAERGEVLRLEEFLEKMEGDGGWRTANEVLGMLGGWKATPSERALDFDRSRWGQAYQEGWATSPKWEPKTCDQWARSQRGGWRAASDVTESSRGRVSELDSKEEVATDFRMDANLRATRRGIGNKEEMHHFVDNVARQEAVDEERRRQMHIFSEMPTEQKIKKIQETIRVLRGHMVTR